MDKKHIIDEIKRTAAENNGQSLGISRFESATGIKYADWYGKFWITWGDALKEAGFSPNKLQGAYSDSFLLEKLCNLIRELGHFPVSGELRMKAYKDKTFPAATTFERLGHKNMRVQKVITYCQQKQWGDVIALCPKLETDKDSDLNPKTRQPEELGYVYLIKHGKHYKIGRTNSTGRRQKELALQLPEQTQLIHEIKTDDPAGIENYWHHRFEQKHTNGEWFELSPADVSAFRKRNFM